MARRLSGPALKRAAERLLAAKPEMNGDSRDRPVRVAQAPLGRVVQAALAQHLIAGALGPEPPPQGQLADAEPFGQLSQRGQRRHRHIRSTSRLRIGGWAPRDLLAPGGMLASIMTLAAEDAARLAATAGEAARRGLRTAMTFSRMPSGERLSQVAARLAQRQLRVPRIESVPFGQAARALDLVQSGEAKAKLVLHIADIAG